MGESMIPHVRMCERLQSSHVHLLSRKHQNGNVNISTKVSVYIIRST